MTKDTDTDAGFVAAEPVHDAARTTEFIFQNHCLEGVVHEGKLWLRASQVCMVLGLSNSRDAMLRLDDDEHTSMKMMTHGGLQTVNAVSRSGALHLTFVSRCPHAKAFRRWVTDAVLPEVFETGSYLGKDRARAGVEGAEMMRLRERLRLPGRYMVLNLPGRPLHIEARDLDEILVEVDQADVQALVSSAQLVGSLWRNFRTEDVILNKAVTENSCGQQLDQAISLSTRLAQWVMQAASTAQKERERPDALTK